MPKINLAHLQKPTDRQFDSTLNTAPQKLEPSQASDFFSTLFSVFQSKISSDIGNKVLLAMCKCITMPKIRAVFIKDSCLFQLPFGSPDYKDQIFDLLHIIVSTSPDAITDELAKKFVKFSRTDSYKTLMLLAVYSQNFENLLSEDTLSWTFIDILFHNATYFRAPECCAYYVSLLADMARRFEDFREARLSNCWNSILSVLASKDDAILSDAYYALCAISECDIDAVAELQFPTAQISRHIKREEVNRACISLLLRVLPPSDEFINLAPSLLTVSKTSSTVSYIVMKMAKQLEFATYLVENPDWMTKPLPSSTCTMQLFAVILRHKSLRKSIVAVPEVFSLFNQIAMRGIGQAFGIITTFIRRLPIDEHFVALLSKKQVLKACWNIVTNIEDDSVVKSWLVLSDTIAKIGYVPELKNTCGLIASVCKEKGELTLVALTVALRLSQYDECVKKLAALARSERFLSPAMKDPQLKNTAQKLQKRLQE